MRWQDWLHLQSCFPPRAANQIRVPPTGTTIPLNSPQNSKHTNLAFSSPSFPAAVEGNYSYNCTPAGPESFNIRDLNNTRSVSDNFTDVDTLYLRPRSFNKKLTKKNKKLGQSHDLPIAHFPESPVIFIPSSKKFLKEPPVERSPNRPRSLVSGFNAARSRSLNDIKVRGSFYLFDRWCGIILSFLSAYSFTPWFSL